MTGGQRTDPNKLIRAVHAARKANGLDDDTYRAMLKRITGKTSSKDLGTADLRSVLDHMNGQQAGQRRFAPPKTTTPLAKKVRALWISLHGLGAIEDASESALRAWVKRQYHVDDLAFIPAPKGYAVIEGLKQWAARLGVDWGLDHDPRICIISAQIQIFRKKYGAAPARRHASGGISEITLAGILASDLTGPQLDQVIETLGYMVRGEHA